MRSRLDTLALYARHLSSGAGASVIVAIIVAAAVFAVALAPRALERLGTAELQAEFSAQSPALFDLSGAGQIGLVEGLPDPTLDELVGPTDAAIAHIASRLPAPLSDGASPALWLIRTKSGKGGLPEPTLLESAIKLAIDLHWDERIRYVAGTAPVVWTGHESDEDVLEQPPIEIALSQSAADLMKVSVGDVIEYHPADLIVAGIYEPVDADDPYWAHASDLAGGIMDLETGKPPTVRAAAYIAPDSLAGLPSVFAFGDLSAWVPLDPLAYEYADVAALSTQVRQASSSQVALPNLGTILFRSGITEVIERVQGRVTSTSALLALTTSGLLGVLLAVFALA
ncbi:MAG: hypothetical protein ABIR65_02335, partial [Pseudolysinimonas sp.]